MKCKHKCGFNTSTLIAATGQSWTARNCWSGAVVRTKSIGAARRTDCFAGHSAEPLSTSAAAALMCADGQPPAVSAAAPPEHSEQQHTDGESVEPKKSIMQNRAPFCEEPHASCALVPPRFCAPPSSSSEPAALQVFSRAAQAPLPPPPPPGCLQRMGHRTKMCVS